MTISGARVCAMLALAALAACQEQGAGNGAPGSSTAAEASNPSQETGKKSVASVAGINSVPLRGVNGIRAQLLADASWESSHCARVRVNNDHGQASTGSWKVVLDLGRATLSQSSGANVSGSTGFVAITPLAGAGVIAPGAWTEMSFCATAPALEREPILVSVSSDLPLLSSDEFEIGLWRLASRTSRHTLTQQPGGGLAGGPFTGSPTQHWRLKARGSGNYSLALEKTQQCLVPSGSALSLDSCAAANTSWTLDTLRVRSEDRPAVYRLRRGNNCLRQNGTTAPQIGNCDSVADLYIEPVGYGERRRPQEYDMRALLLIKPSTDVQSPRMIGTIPSATVLAAQTAHNEHLAVWFERMTDGRIKWVGESAIASPMTSVVFDGGNALPAASTMGNDVRTWLPMGKYDAATVFFIPGTDAQGNPVSGGWGWGPGISPESNMTMWSTVAGGGVPAAEWTSWRNEPMEVFIHEPMHGMDGFFAQFGVPLPDGWLHGAEANLYQTDQTSWMHWYRDYLLGTVIAADDTYRGYGPRAFRHGTPRAAAAKLVQRTVVFMFGQTNSGQDMFLRGGIDHGAALNLLGKTCTQANMQCAIPMTHRNLRNATTSPWKSGDAYLDWYGREPGQTLTSPGHGLAEGTAADWTTNNWTYGNPVRTVAIDGYGQEPLNTFGAHYWMLDVDMDCSKAFLDPRDGVTRWVEIKSYISNGPGWEGNVVQADRPYASGNHFAKCGKINVFERGSGNVRYFNF